MACMHCTDAPCQAVCPVSCIYTTADGVVLHSANPSAAAATTPARSARRNIRASAISARELQDDKCTIRAGGPEADGSEKSSGNAQIRTARGSCRGAEMCSTKSSAATARSLRRFTRNACASAAYGSGAWGWTTAYRETIEFRDGCAWRAISL